MNAFQLAWEATGKAEGGYSNNSHDSGGPTKYGITEKVARQHEYMGDMRLLPRERAGLIAKRAYWDSMRLDEVADMSEELAFELFDTGFNAGQQTAVLMLQRLLNALNKSHLEKPEWAEVDVDGKMGDFTLLALDAYLEARGDAGALVLLRGLNGLQVAYYIDLVERREKDEEFFYGWLLNRIEI